MSVLNLDALRPELVDERPFRWGFIPQIVTLDSIRELRDSFPTEDFWLNEGYDGEKTYRFRLRPLVTANPSRLAPLAPIWEQLATELVGPAFRTAMGRLLGREVVDCAVEADLFRLGPGDWIGPHRDLPTKLASLIVYLNEDGWVPAHGGCLRVLRTCRDSARVAEVPPTSGGAVLIVRSRRSWHSVTPLAPTAPSERLSFQVILWRPERESSNWTVDPDTGAVAAGRRVYNGSPPRRALAWVRDSVASRAP